MFKEIGESISHAGHITLLCCPFMFQRRSLEPKAGPLSYPSLCFKACLRSPITCHLEKLIVSTPFCTCSLLFNSPCLYLSFLLNLKSMKNLRHIFNTLPGNLSSTASFTRYPCNYKAQQWQSEAAKEGSMFYCILCTLSSAVF